MPSILRSSGIVATVALVGYAAILLMADPDVDDVVDDAIADALADEDQAGEVERRRERLEVVARGAAMSPAGPNGEAAASEAPMEAGVAVPHVEYGSGELDLPGVRSGFTYAMDRVDTIADRRTRITVEDWDKLYRETNDAFSALSIMLDANDEAQAAELEAAHKQLKKGLKRVRVRGRKFGT